MPERDRHSSAEQLRPDSRPDRPADSIDDAVNEQLIFAPVESRSEIGSNLRESTVQLIETLQFRLDRMRTIENSRASEVAMMCQAELDNIRRQIGAIGEEEGPGNSG